MADDDLAKWEKDLAVRAVAPGGVMLAGPQQDPDLADWEHDLGQRARRKVPAGEIEPAKSSQWTSAHQVWEGLTQGLPTMWQAKKEALSGGRSYSEVMERYRKEREQYEKDNPVRSALELAGGSVASSIPLLGLGSAVAEPGLARAAGALTRLAPALDTAGGRLAGAAARGAGEGALAGTIQSGLGKESVGSQALEGAEYGAALGPLGRILGAPFRSNISPRTAAIADRMLELGIPLRSADLPGAPLTARGASKLIGPSGELKAEAFTRALGKTFGEDLEKIDYPSVMKARDRIGKEFDALAPLVKVPQLEPDLMHDIGGLKQQVAQLDPKIYSPVTKALENVETMVASGDIDGEALKSIRGPGGSVGSLARSTDGTMRHYGQQLEHALMEAAGRNSSPNVLERLGKAKQQYKNLLIADSISNEATGIVDPTKLLKKVEGKYSSAHEAKAEDIGTLGMGGREFLSPPPKPTSAGKSSAHKAAGTAALGAVAGEQLAEHAPALLSHMSGGNEALTGLAALYAASGLGHGLYAQSAPGTRNLLNAARGSGGLPWWAGRGVQPLIPVGTALEGQKW